ncbi:TaqI-like C-terminal specificity domain-containing protein, partial [Vagococcus fluvialis]|uniref:TaqI-like C-terminal specificity domain-containing protein n=1 Tax=Vagococcus fluvialis TaxID=2738 RepID=UPI003B5C38B7
ENPRILVRQIPSQQTYSIEAVYVDEDVINDRNSMIITNIKINPYALLGILNSQIMSLWFLMKFDKFQRRIFPQFKINELGEFPIPNMNYEVQDNLATLVKRIMNENSKIDPDKKNLENLNFKIDNMVMDIFNLSEEEKNVVRNFKF